MPVTDINESQVNPDATAGFLAVYGLYVQQLYFLWTVLTLNATVTFLTDFRDS